MRRKIPAAIREGDLEALQKLLKEDPSAHQLRTEKGLSFLLLALYYGRRDMAKLLRGDGSRLDITEAAALGEVDRVRELLAADPAAAGAFANDGFSALHLASYFHHAEIVGILLRAGADANAPSRNQVQLYPLHSALAQTEHAAAESIVLALLNAKADPSARNAIGVQPIHLAVVNGHEAAAALLVKAGADPNARADDGKTPAMMLAEKLLLPPL